MKLLQKKSIIVFSGIIFIIVLHYSGMTKAITNQIQKNISPIQSTLYKASAWINTSLSKKNNPDEIADEIKRLRDENKKLLSENIALKLYSEQFSKLQDQSQFLLEKKFLFVNARIVAKDTYQQINFLTIDKGLSDGIIIGLPVVVDEGIIIGKIYSVDKNSSKVMLLTNVKSQTAGMLLNNENIFGVISGDYGISLKMELIPREEKIDINQKIITSGIEERIPKGLIIGEVSRVEKENHGFFQRAFLRPAASYNNLSFVSVLKDQ